MHSCRKSQAILETLAHATRVYGRRNVRMLYDALSTLAEAVGRALAEPTFLQLLMPALLGKWQVCRQSSPPELSHRGELSHQGGVARKCRTG